MFVDTFKGKLVLSINIIKCIYLEKQDIPPNLKNMFLRMTYDDFQHQVSNYPNFLTRN